MRGRIMHVTVKKELLDEALKVWPTYTPNFFGRGLIASFMMVDRDTCQVRSVTIWDSQESITKNENRPELAPMFASFEKYYADKPYWLYFDLPAWWIDSERIKELI
ncbi:MAG: hypothetical protein FJX35_05760 [Alphaproteobacteria bacterium]|nr:hypothetical protein [Alphaproteobacteria bacterium]